MLLIVFGDLMEKLEIIENLLILAVADLFGWGEQSAEDAAFHAAFGEDFVEAGEDALGLADGGLHE